MKTQLPTKRNYFGFWTEDYFTIIPLHIQILKHIKVETSYFKDTLTNHERDKIQFSAEMCIQ